jgi:hypothetical protein
MHVSLRAKSISNLIVRFAGDHLSACSSALCLMVFFLCIWLVPINPSETSTQFVAEAVRQFGFTGSKDQRIAHLLTVIAAASFSAAAFVLARYRTVQIGDRRFFPRLGAVGCIVLATIGLLSYLILVQAWLVMLAAAVLVCLFVFALKGPALRVDLIDRVGSAVIGAYLALLVIPGLFVQPLPLMAADPVSLAQFENHILYLTMTGSAIAAGQDFFDQLPFSYGLLMPSIMSVFERRFHALAIGDQLRVVEVTQVLFALSAVAAYVSYRPRAVIGILVAVLVAGPYWASAGLGIWHPNQTGFRSLGLAVGMLALMLSARWKTENTAWCLGAIGGAAILMNLETAIAVAAGFSIFMIVRTQSIPFGLYARMSGASLGVVGLYLICYRLALGRLPFSDKAIDFLSLIERFTSGAYGGRLFESGYERSGYFLVPFALAMFLHAIYLVVEGFRRLGSGPLQPRAAQRVAVATTLIVWLTYYFNSPNWWQIWTHLFLYGLLIIDQFDHRLFGIGRGALSKLPVAERLRHMRVSPQRLFLLLYVALIIPHTNRHLVNFTADFMYPSWLNNRQEVSVVSGVLMPNDLAEALQRKAKKLVDLKISSGNRVAYLTFNMAFMPRLSGIFQPHPFRDPFTEIRGDAVFDRTLEDLMRQRPDVILLDAPRGPLTTTGARRDFQDRLRHALARSYQNSGTEDGWEIWRPVKSP